MCKKTTTEVLQSLHLTRKTLRVILAYHPELWPSEPPQPPTLSHFTEALWSDAEIERLRVHCTRPWRRDVVA